MADNDYDAIYLSPHLDDASLSCGGQIFDRTRRGERVLIVTVFTADIPGDVGLSDFAARVVADWGLDSMSAMAQRRTEDLAACDALGADASHLDLVDALFRSRGDQPRYVDWQTLRLARPRDELGIVDHVGTALEALPGSTFVAAPFGAGHVDHQILRAAAQDVFGPKLVFYDDLPYALEMGLRRRFRRLFERRLKSEILEVSAAGHRAKLESIACYASQSPRENLLPAAETALRRAGGERLWWWRD